MGDGAGDTPGVIAPPPLIYLGSILLGAAIHHFWPAPFFPAGAGPMVGGVLIGAAAAIFVLAFRQFQRAGTPVPTRRPTRTIVRSGPYRFTRNPIYLAFTLLHLGVAIWVNSAWLLLTLAITLVVIRAGVIAREEKYLVRKFGAEYESYRSAVRRWL